MFGHKLKLFSLFGFEVSVDASWIFIAVLVAWSLASGLFPGMYENLSTQTYWIMGVIGAIGLFASIIFHEFWHSLAARSFGMPMKGITLFLFGGVAEMEDEPPSAKIEAVMALAGPAASVVIGLVFLLLAGLGNQMGWTKPVMGVVGYLGTINLLLAAFNMIPAYPLDGGRVLRSILWAVKKDLNWATKLSSRVGGGFGLALIVLGVINVLYGGFISGMWWALIGMFIRGVSKASYQQLLAKQTLSGQPLSRFMKEDPVTVPQDISVRELVEDYFYQHHYKMFPIVEGDRVIGCVNSKDVKEISRDDWDRTGVGRLAHSCSIENTIRSDADAAEALKKMQNSGASRLMVIDDDRLVGVIALKDLLHYLTMKMEFES
jgi:Zn-dependent protease